MANRKEFLGGFIGITRLIGGTSVIPGVYNTGDQIKLKNSYIWRNWVENPTLSILSVGTGSGTATLPDYANHAFVSIAGGSGSGAHDNDCNGQGPGGPGGASKSIISLNTTGRSVTYTSGSGGNGTGGNDVWGNPGNASSITIGNFSLTANGGQGGRAKNGGGNAGPSGSVSVSGPYINYSTTDLGYPDSFAISEIDQSSATTFGSIPASATGSPGQCGNPPSAPGAHGHVYILYGHYVNANTTLTRSEFPPFDPLSYSMPFTIDYS
jgi:hypothetical protein